MTNVPTLKGYLLMKTGPDSYCFLALTTKQTATPVSSVYRWEIPNTIYTCRRITKADYSAIWWERNRQRRQSLCELFVVICMIVALAASAIGAIG